MDGVARGRIVGLAAAIVLAPSVARADAREVAARVAEQWKTDGAKVTTLPTRFLFDDDRQVIAIPAPPDDAHDGCTYVALVAARGLSFRARLSGASNDPLLPPEPGARASSTAGVIGLYRCDAAHPVRHVEVRSDAGRGAVEIVVAYGPRGLPALSSIVPERTGGPVPPMPDAGTLGVLASQEKRLDRAEQRARSDGASIEPRTKLHAGSNGTGETELDVAAGCHRFEVVGHDRSAKSARRFRIDVDAELRDGETVLARDRTEAPDARLEACVGKSSRLTLVFAGAAPDSDVVVARGSWPLPPRLPSLWGAAAKSRMARAFFVRHVATPADDPVFLAQGGAGTTPVPLPVEVGACYVAVIGVSHGRARQLQLRVTVGGRESVDERGAADEAALGAFCIRAAEHARIEVLARPSDVTWGLAVYRVKSGIWEPGR